MHSVRMRQRRRGGFKMAESDSGSKVECRSKRALGSIISAINEHIECIVSGNKDTSSEEKERCRLRFKEVEFIKSETVQTIISTISNQQ